MGVIWNPNSEFLREPNLLIPGKKPVGAVKIDWGHSLADGISYCFLSTPTGFIDLANSNKFPSLDTSTRRVAPNGYSREYDTTNKTVFSNSSRYNIIGPHSIFMVMDFDAAVNYGALIAYQTTSTVDGIELRMGTSSSGRQIAYYKFGDGRKQWSGQADIIEAGSKGNTIGISQSDNLIETAPIFIINTIPVSVDITGSGQPGTGPIVNPATNDLFIGRRYDNNTKLDGAIALIIGWGNRDIGAGGLTDLSHDPYQFLISA